MKYRNIILSLAALAVLSLQAGAAPAQFFDGCAILQFGFSGAIDRTITATAKSDEGYNKANISAVFLD